MCLQFGGVNLREVKNNPDGTFDISELKDKIRTNCFYEPKTSLICVENTHNLFGGKVVPQEWLDEVRLVYVHLKKVTYYREILENFEELIFRQ